MQKFLLASYMGIIHDVFTKVHFNMNTRLTIMKKKKTNNFTHNTENKMQLSLKY